MESVPAGGFAIEADVLAARGGDQQAFTRLVAATCTLVLKLSVPTTLTGMVIFWP